MSLDLGDNPVGTTPVSDQKTALKNSLSAFSPMIIGNTYPFGNLFSEQTSGICDIYGPYVFPKDPESITSLNQGQIGNIFGVADFSELKNLTSITSSSINYGFSSINLNSKSIINFEYANNGDYLKFLNLNNCSNLSTLSCGYNQLPNLSIAGCTGLINFDCVSNLLTDLNFSGFNKLSILTCSYNQLTGLNIDGCTSLSTFNCVSNQLTNLNLGGLTGLTSLICTSNQLTGLNVSGCTSLNSLSCYNNQLTNLDVSELLSYDNSLSILYCFGNQLTGLQLTPNTLSVYNNETLTILNCGNNQLTDLDLHRFTNLTTLNCGYNLLLTGLMVFGCTSLSHLYCDDVSLTNLNVAGLANLNTLNFRYAPATSLNAAGCTNLGTLNCSYNQLTGLNIAGCSNLTYIDCSTNQLTSTSVNHILITLSGFNINDGNAGLAGEGNEPPTGAGISAKNYLIDQRGWSISTN